MRGVQITPETNRHFLYCEPCGITFVPSIIRIQIMFKWCNIKWFFTSYLWALDWYWYNDWLDSDAFWQIFQLWFWLLLNLCSHSLSLSYHLSPLPLARLIIAADTGHWSETPGALFGYQQCVSEMIMSHVLYTLMKYINNHNKVVLHLAHSIHVTHTI